MRVATSRDIAEVASNHHESLDLPSRIPADVYDALSQDRPYRPAMAVEEVLGILRKESDAELCPLSVAALEELVSRGDL